MNDGRCPHCGGTNPPNSAFCGSCGTSLPAEQPDAPADVSSSSQWQPPAPIQPVPPQPPLPTPYPPPPSAFPPPPGVYPPPVFGAKVVGDNTKWALGLGIASLFCCGPFTGIIGVFLAKKDMDESASGRAPQLDGQLAKVAFYLNIGALILFVAGICLFWGRLGLGRL